MAQVKGGESFHSSSLQYSQFHEQLDTPNGPLQVANNMLLVYNDVALNLPTCTPPLSFIPFSARQSEKLPATGWPKKIIRWSCIGGQMVD